QVERAAGIRDDHVGEGSTRVDGDAKPHDEGKSHRARVCSIIARMPTRIDLNADMGESYGRWTLGDDEALMPHLTSANIACGFHGGDPHVMRRTVALALDHGVGIGAPVAFPDRIGSGRRRLAAPSDEVE